MTSTSLTGFWHWLTGIAPDFSGACPEDHAKTQCPHTDWSIGVYDTVNMGHCNICGNQIHLGLLVDVLRRKVESLEKEIHGK